jgi:hypothetical protein
MTFPVWVELRNDSYGIEQIAILKVMVVVHAAPIVQVASAQ